MTLPETESIEKFKEKWEGEKIEIDSFDLLPAFQHLNVAQILDNDDIIIEIDEVHLGRRVVYIRCDDFLTIINFKTAQKLVNRAN